jgi:hypothetical protein
VKDLGIDDLENKYGLAIYPNPSQGDFNISFNANPNEEYTLNVYDAVGKLLISEIIKQQEGVYVKEVKLTKEAAGVYTVVLSNGMIETNRKLILKR